MTTFTITCPPASAGMTERVFSATASEIGSFANEIDGSIPLQSYNGSTLEVLSTDISNNVFRFFNESRFESDYFPEDEGGGNEYFWTEINTTSKNNATTLSWDGGRTEVINETLAQTYNNGIEYIDDTQTNTTVVWTSFNATSSQTTTTQTATVYTTTVSEATNVTTLSGTTVQTGNMKAPEPRTTITQTQGFTTKEVNLSATRITTTTHQDSFAKWRTGEGGGTHRGTYQIATVVCLETSNLGTLRPEMAWIVTSRPEFTATLNAVVEQQETPQFTVFPSFVTAAGHVEQATYDTDTEDFTFSTSSEVIETPTTYITTRQTKASISAAFPFVFTALPSPTFELSVGPSATTITTENWFGTIIESLFTGEDISTTTIFSTTTHQGRIGTVTWNATHRRSTTAQTLFDISTAYTYSQTQTLPVQTNGYSYTNGFSETRTITFNRPIAVHGIVHNPTAIQNQCGSSLSFAVAAASNLTSAAQQIGAAGISVNFPVLVNAARTVSVPLGSWSYVTAGTSIRASAGPNSLMVTSAFGNPASITSTAGLWTTAGAAVSRANLPFGHRINMGGTPPTGVATAFYDAGVFSTSYAGASGTMEAIEAYTQTIDQQEGRTAYLPAKGVFISQRTLSDANGDPVFSSGERYNTSARNITQTIAESAIITDSFQLIL